MLPQSDLGKQRKGNAGECGTIRVKTRILILKNSCFTVTSAREQILDGTPHSCLEIMIMVGLIVSANTSGRLTQHINNSLTLSGPLSRLYMDQNLVQSGEFHALGIGRN